MCSATINCFISCLDLDSSRHSSVQGESDSEPEGFISSMTSKLGNIFSSDSSDADVSETEDNDEQIDLTLDKPVFLTSRGPVHMSAGSNLSLYWWQWQSLFWDICSHLMLYPWSVYIMLYLVLQDSFRHCCDYLKKF